MGVTALANKSWKTGATTPSWRGPPRDRLKLAGTIGSGLDTVIGVVLAVSGLIFVGLGRHRAPRSDEAAGDGLPRRRGRPHAGGLWIMGAF